MIKFSTWIHQPAFSGGWKDLVVEQLWFNVIIWGLTALGVWLL